MTKTAVASYVCPILIDEGYAEKVEKGKETMIRFYRR